MKFMQQLQALPQSLWLDNITRDLLDSGTLRRYVDEFSVTGLTSNPTIFDEAIGATGVYDAAIRAKANAGANGEALFVELALEDLRRAADLFRPTFVTSGGLDGWVSMEVSPLLLDDAQATVSAAKSIHRLADRPNLYVKIPGSTAGLTAIEQSIFDGIPINVTLLFSREHYLAAAQAYMRGIERRIAAGRDPKVSSVASLFISRWDRAVSAKVPAPLQNLLGSAPTAPTASSSSRSAGAISPLPAHARSGCSGRARAPRIRRRRRRCTSRPSPRQTPSTPCRKRRCSPPPRMAF